MRVRECYAYYAEKYGVGWKGRSYTPGTFELSDLSNQILTACNAALYSLINSCLVAMGFSPHIGFIHSGSPLPFTYDLADLYKEDVCIDTAFYLTLELAGEYNKYRVADEFRQRILRHNVLGKIGEDINMVLGVK